MTVTTNLPIVQPTDFRPQNADRQRSDVHAERKNWTLRSVRLNGRAWEQNNTPLQGGHRPARLIGATPEIERD
ncbi:hypothetical protein [uncultured Desulfuromonas sp.]|uniref:hypothetical protein n=1 Tax=uncultured Desulfuromonas sp. TaxID=181013 RepID=UPI002AAB0C4B|nr:hypothetical protein [uncultured Desulfuromonas sp.]